MAVSLILLPLRDSVPNTSAALLLVLVLVGVASTGARLVGLLAALSAGPGFDFLLTQPHESLSIASAADAQTALLLPCDDRRRAMAHGFCGVRWSFDAPMDVKAA